MDNNGLLFIPDISGFTKFVNEIEIEHSRYIIGELLGNIILKARKARGKPREDRTCLCLDRQAGRIAKDTNGAVEQ